MKRQRCLIKYLRSSPRIVVSGYEYFVRGLPFLEGINSSQLPPDIGSMFFWKKLCSYWVCSNRAWLWPRMVLPNTFHGQSHNSGHLWGAEGEGGGALGKWQQQIMDQKKIASAFDCLLLDNLSSALPILTEALAFLRNEDHSGWWPRWPDQVRDLPRHNLATEICSQRSGYRIAFSVSYFCLCWPPLSLCCLLLLAEGL